MSKIETLSKKQILALAKKNMAGRVGRTPTYDWRKLKLNQSFFVTGKRYSSMAVLAYMTAQRLTKESGKTVKFSTLHDTVKGKEGVRIVRIA